MEYRALTSLIDKVATDIVLSEAQLPSLMKAVINNKQEWRFGKFGRFRTPLPGYIVAIEVGPRREFAGYDGMPQSGGGLLVRLWHLQPTEE
jgi:hypothetical protein